AENMYRAAQGLIQIDKLADAEAQLRGALSINPTHLRAGELFADILISRRGGTEARTVLQRPYEDNPAAPLRRLWHVLLQLAAETPDGTMKLGLYERVIVIDKKNVEAITGILQLAAKTPDGTMKLGLYERVIAIDEKNVEAITGIREVWRRRGD